MTMIFVAIGWLAISLALLIPTNRLAQRLLPTLEQDTPSRRYFYGLVVKAISFSVFAIVGAAIVGGSILFGLARW
jgi:hypothetical protein